MSQNSANTFLMELLSFSSYKRNQGRLARRLTGAAIAAIAILGAWALRNAFLSQSDVVIGYGIPLTIGALGCCLGFRVMHHPKFAEFLIATESEVEKVHWPDRPHVHRATIVVMVTMLLMGAMLFVFDMIWREVFSYIGFLEFV